MIGKKRKQSFRVLAVIISLLMMLENTSVLALASDSDDFRGYILSNDVPREEASSAPSADGGEQAEEVPGQNEELFEEVPGQNEEPFEEVPGQNEEPFEEVPGQNEEPFEEVPGQGEEPFEEVPEQNEEPSQEQSGTAAAETEMTVPETEEPVLYQVFFASEGAETITVSVPEGEALGSLPDAPEQDGMRFTGWYTKDGTSVDESFVPAEDVTVTAHFVKDWTVTYMVRGEQYHTQTAEDQSMITSFPAEPSSGDLVFLGWYDQDTVVTESTIVTGDLVLTAKFGAKVTFRLEKGEEYETVLERVVEENTPLGTLPADPFLAGSRFTGWFYGNGEAAGTGDIVTGTTVITGAFQNISIYTITVEYFYNKEGEDFLIDQTVVTVDANKVTDAEPVTILSPSQFTETGTGIRYYPAQQTVQITLADLAQAGEDRSIHRSVEYSTSAVSYSFVYLLKDLTGEGYTQIPDSTVTGNGVMGSLVTPEIKNFDFAVFEKTQPATITQAGQELPVYYTRKNVSLIYDTQGGSSVDPVVAPYGTEVTLTAATPVRTGYTFKGWYLDEECRKAAGQKITLNESTTVYAKWEGKTVNYQIVYMKEKYQNGTGEAAWVYDNSRTATGTVGETVSASSAPALTNNINGYEKDTEKNASSSITIAADGSSVLTVYYRLIRYTFVFNLNNTKGRITMGGTTYSGSEYQISNVVLGQDVSSMWPSSSNEVYSTDGQYFSGWTGASATYITKRYEVIWDNVSKANSSRVMTFKASWAGSSHNRNAEYWLQQPDGTWVVADEYTQIGLNTNNLGAKDLDGYTKHDGTAGAPRGYEGSGEQVVTREVWVEAHEETYSVQNKNSASKQQKNSPTLVVNGRTYTYSHTESSGWLSTNYTHYYVCNVEGHYETQSSSTYTYRFYYDRNSFNIDYYDGGSLIAGRSDILFGTDISGGSYDFVPAAPAGKEDYTWGGWYEDSRLNNKYSFRTMPGNNLALYAGWIPPKYTVNFHNNYEGAEDLYQTQTINKNAEAADPGTPARENYRFLGWFTAAQGGRQYLAGSEAVTKDMDLYAHWEMIPLKYTVKYILKATGERLFTDKTVENPVFVPGQTITEQAVTVAGYLPYDSTKSVSLDFNADNNIIVFEYVPKTTELHYTVRYVLQEDPSVEVAGEKKVTVNGTYASVTETAAPVTNEAYQDYRPLEMTKTLHLGANSDTNIMTFYYVPDGAVVSIEWTDMDGVPLAGTQQALYSFKTGESFGVPYEVNGYTLHHIWDNVSPGNAGQKRYVVENHRDIQIRVYMQKNLTIAARSKSKVYDGTILEDSGTGDVTVSGLISSHALESIAFTSGRTDVGTSSVRPHSAVIRGAGEDYYRINYVSGSLTVTKASVVINVEPDRWNDGPAYDGTERTIGFRKLRGSADAKEGVEISHPVYEEQYGRQIRDMVRDITLTQKDAGFYTLPAARIRQAISLPVDANYNAVLNVRDGELTIPQAQLTVRTGSAGKVYDGTALTCEEASVEGLVPGETLDIAGAGSQTDAGSSSNFCTITWGSAKESNYNVTEIPGTLTVERRPVTVTITGNCSTDEYDGQEHTISGFIATADTDLYDVTENLSFTGVGEVSASRTDAGTTYMGLTEDQFVSTNDNFAEASFVIRDGYQKIEPANAEVIIQGHRDVVRYDGREHTVSGYDVTGSHPAYKEQDFIFDGVAEVSRRTAGVTQMGLTSAMFKNRNPNFRNVTFHVTDGSLEISPADEVVVTITGHSSIAEYDGQEHTVNGYDVQCSDPLYTESDFIFNGTAQAAASLTDVGTAWMGLSEDQFENQNPNFEKVEFRVTDGYQTITPAPVSVAITGHTAGTDYDGSAHRVIGYETVISNPLYRERDFIFNGSAQAVRSDAGTTKMGLSAGQFINTNANFAPVTFSVTDGYQTIRPAAAEVVITGHKESSVYDGTEHSADGYDVTISNPLYTENDFTFSGSAQADRTDAGVTRMGLSGEQFTNTNLNFDPVTFRVTDGSQTILPAAASVRITENSGRWDYDGNLHSVNGYDVQSDNPLYSVKDFVFSGTSLVSAVNAGTYEMDLQPEDFVNVNPNFAGVTFEIVDGSLRIDPVKAAVTISGHTDRAAYNGAGHEVSGYDMTADHPLYTENDYTFSGSALASRVDAGTTYMGLAADQFENVNPNFGEVTFLIEDGYQTVDPVTAEVFITGRSSTVDYDGTEHVVSGYDVISNNPLYTEADFAFSGSDQAARTDAGTTDMGLSADQFENSNPNFTDVVFHVTDGRQTILPLGAVVTITGHAATSVYDGSEHRVDGYDVEISSPLYSEADFAFVAEDGSGTAQAVRTETGTTMMGLTAAQFVNTNNNFSEVRFNVTDGYQAITPADEVVVTITGHRNTAEYDGAVHQVSGYDVQISSELYTEENFEFAGTEEDMLAERTDAGITYMGLTEDLFVNRSENFRTVLFRVTDGYQQITPASALVTVTEHSDRAEYDGREHSVSGYDVSIDNPLYSEDDFTFGGDAFVRGTHAGIYDMQLSPADFANRNANFDNVSFVIADGRLVIDPAAAAVTITEHGGSADYNGQQHIVTGYDAVIDNPLYSGEDFLFSGNDMVTGTEAGSYDMQIKAEDFANINPDFANVTFAVEDNSLVIHPIDVTVDITGHHSVADYDGEAHAVRGYDVQIPNRLYTEADFTFSGTGGGMHETGDTVSMAGEAGAEGAAAVIRTDAGTTYMGLLPEQFSNTNRNFRNVTFRVTDGYLTVNPVSAVVTITGRSSTEVYDGKEHSVSGYDVQSSSPLYTEAGFVFTGTAASASRTQEGLTFMGLHADQFENRDANFENVSFLVTDGYQEITPVDEVVVTITGHSDTSDYDGTEHTVSGYDIEISNDLYTEADFTFSAEATAARTDAGRTEMGLSEDQFANNNGNFAKVVFRVTDGYQEIVPIQAAVAIVGRRNTTVYDGEEHRVAGYDAEISNPLYTEADFTFSAAAEAARTDAGTTEMGLGVDQFTNINGNFSRVTFDVTDGYQTITPVDEVVVTITGHHGTADYDGKEHGVEGYDVQISDPLYTEADFTFSGAAAAARTDAGTTGMGLTAAQFTNTNENFANVTFHVTDGYQTIDLVDVTVTVTEHTGTVNYDGEAHEVTGYDVSTDNALYTEADFIFSGDALVRGTDAGSYDMELKPEDFTNTNGNFANVTFVIEDGQLVINPVEVTVTINGRFNSTIYDGEEHSVEGYDVQISNHLYTEADFTFDAAAKAARTDAGTTPMGLTAAQFTNTNRNFAEVTFVVNDGYQTIDPVNVTVTITGRFNTATYDGAEHSVDGYDVQISNDLYTEADFTFSGAAAAARTEEGTTVMGLAADQFANTNDNFAAVTFNVTDGYQTITPVDEVAVTITGHHNTTGYDGEEHSVAGYDVEISDPLYTEADFTFDGTAEAARTDAGTTFMGLAADQFTNTNPNFAAVTFIVTDGYQAVDPAGVTVTITEHSGVADYNGAEHTVTGYDVSIDNALYTEADFTFSGDANISGTDAGSYDMELKPEDFTNTNGNFANVTFVIVDGQLVIDPIDVTVTITGAGNTADYDGKEHSVSGYTAVTGSSLYDVTKDFTFSGTAKASRTNVLEGTDIDGRTGMGLAADQFTNTNPNFGTVTFSVTDGYQAITPIDVTVTITEHSGTVNYDGETHTVNGYDVSIDNDLYTEADFTFSGNDHVSGTNAGSYDMELKPEDFTNTNGNFANVTFVIVDGQLVIDPIDVTVTVTEHSGTVNYDGEAHEVTGYDVSTDNALYTEADFTFRGDALVSGTDAGSYDMELKPEDFTNTNGNFANITFVIVDGQLVISPVNVTVTINGRFNTTTYDGEEHSVEGYDVEISNDLYTEADFTFSGAAAAARTEEGTTVMGLNADQFANTNNNFAAVTFVVTDGYQTITPVDEVVVTITGHHNTTDYDGAEHSVEGYDVEISDPLYTEADFTFDGTAGAARTDAGTTVMGLNADQFTNTNRNFAKVTFVVTDGYQTIDPVNVTVTITGANNKTDYDGVEHAVSGYTATASSDLYDVTKDFTFSGTARASRTNVVEGTDTDGQTDMGLNADQFTNINTNFGTVTFDVTDGFQRITPIDVTVTITGANNTADYDGEEHFVSGYTAVAGNDLYDVTKDFTFRGTAEAARMDAGQTDMGLAADQFENTNTNFGAVTFDVTDGYQTINPVDVTVTITEHSGTVYYDGEAHEVTGYDVSIDNALYTEEDFTFSGNALASGTDAGSYDMELKPEDFTNTNGNFANVTFVIVDGQLVINPIDVTVTITEHAGAENYDGEAHEVMGYDVSIDNALYTEADFTFSGNDRVSGTNAGSYDMELKPEDFTNTNGNFANVTFVIVDGQLVISPINVTVTINGRFSTVTYDGAEHSVEGYDVQISNDLYTEADFTFSGAAAAARTEEGTTVMGLAADQFANINDNFAIVTFVVTDGYQTITPVDEVVVTITGHHNTADYDGEAHSVEGYDVEISDPLYTEADFTFDGTAGAARTDAGTTVMGLNADQFTNTNRNFAKVTFAVTDGYQTIDPVNTTVTITGANNTADYDGGEHAVSGYTAAAGSDLYDAAKDFTFSGTAEAARTDAGTMVMGLNADQFTNTNPNFAVVTFVVTDGYQTITPIDVTVTITEHSGTENYNGETHEVNGYDVSIDNDLYTEADFTFSGDDRVSGTDAGSYDMELKPEDFTNTNNNFANVTFVIVDGQLVINPINVTVTINGRFNTTTYDGAEHSVEGYDAQISNDLYTEADFTFSGAAAAARTEEGTTVMGLAADQFANTNENFATVTFIVTDGYQAITPVDGVVVTITGHHNTADYDGEAHSVDGYDVEISDPLYTEADFTFDGTAGAARTDAGTTVMGLNADQFTNTNRNFAKVTFAVTDGYQTIDPVNAIVTITGHADTATYDGKEHSVEGYDVRFSSDLYTEADFTFSGTAAAARTEEGTTVMGLAADQFANTNNNFAAVTFVVTDGYQTITPVEEVVVTITGHHDTTNYDGEEHRVAGYDVEISDPLYTEADFTFDGTAEAVRTDAGTTGMGLTAAQFTNKNGNFAKVTFVVTDGCQTIEPVDVTVTITEHSGEADYSGAMHEVSGYDVSIDNALYTEADFTFSGNALVSGTNAGSYDMELKPGDFTNTNGNFANVTFVIVDGQLVIDPIDVTVTIAEHSGTVNYDGEVHEVRGYDVSMDNALYTEADFTFSGNALISGTDAGSYDMELKPEDFTNTNGNFANVTFVIADGQLMISPINVTVTINGHFSTVTYDGAEHSVAGYDVQISNDLYTQADFTFSAEAEAARTDEGTTVMGLAADQFANTNDNFAAVTFVVTDGYQTITPVDEVVVTITGHHNTADYDGEAHSVAGYDVEISDPLYTEDDFTFDGTAEAARTDAGTTVMGLNADQFTNTNGNFATVTFVVTDGYQTIDPVNAVVTITGANNRMDYDGEAHTVTGYSVSINNALYTEADFTFSGTAEAVRTDAGTTVMGLAADQFTNTNANFAVVTFNVTDGYQTIDPVDVTVTITGHADTVNYNGEAHEVTGYDVSIDNALYTEADFTFSGNDRVSGTDAGSYDMDLKPEDFTNTNGNFADVTFVIVDGQLVIEPVSATVTITGHFNTSTYDSEEHRAEGYDVQISNDLYTEADFTFSGSAEASRTDEGTTVMGLAADQFTNTNANFAAVTFVVIDGYQTITPVEEVVVTITGHHNTADYDGEEHRMEGYDVEISDPLYTEADFTFDGTAEAARTEAGTTVMGLNADQFTNTNANFAAVTFVVTDGYQTIDPIHVTVTITGNRESRIYNGSEQKTEGYQVRISNELYTEDDFTFSGEPAAKGTEAGVYPMGLTRDQFTNKNESFIAAFAVTDGELKITPLAVTVTITGIRNSDGETVYDGTEHTIAGYKVTDISSSLYRETDFIFGGTDSVSGTDAGVYPMQLKPEDFVNINPSFGPVTFEIADGALTITPRSVTLTSVTDSREYNGVALTNREITVDGDGWAEGEGASYDVTGSQTVVGTSANSFTYALDEGTKADNYIITIIPGTLTVTSRDAKYEITIESNSDTAIYDGTKHTVSGVKTLTFTVDGNVYTVSGLITEDPGAVNAGTYTNNITGTPVVTDSEGRDVSDQFAVRVKNGSLVIGKRSVTLTSASAEKPYDGTPLTNDKITVGGDGWAEGEGAEYTVTGSQTLVGRSENTFTYTLNEGTLKDNYIITTQNELLTVTDQGAASDLIVTKEAEDRAYALGETVVFNITMTNIYDEARTIVLKELLDGAVLTESTFANVAAGDTVSAAARYVITEADILAGSVTNTVEVSIGDAGGKTAQKTIVTGAPEGHLTVTKTTDVPEGTKVSAGDVILYTITVMNDGNLTISDITVTDDLTGDVWKTGSLKPSESRTFRTAYTVTWADMLAGSVKNMARAAGDHPDSAITITDTATTETGTEEIKPEEKPQVTVPGTTTSAAPEAVAPTGDPRRPEAGAPTGDPQKPGKTVTPGKTVAPADESTADVPVRKENSDSEKVEEEKFTLIVHYYDQDGRQVFGDHKATYISGSNYDVASPALEGFTPDQARVKGTITEDTELTVIYAINTYTLTVYYCDLLGNIVAPPYTAEMLYGAAYSVQSPGVDGYRSLNGEVTGTMPARDVEATVFYMPIVQPDTAESDAAAETVVIEDYDTALGLGSISLNAGECLE